MTEEIPASPEMQKFFERLLKVKGNLKVLEDRVACASFEIQSINEELNDLIKGKNET